MTTFSWPAILKPRDFGYFFLDADQSGGAALGGGEQIVFSPGPRWGAAMTLDLRLRESDELLALRALRTNLKGRANPVALPNFDGQRLSWPEELTADGNPTGVILHPGVTRDKALDGTLYADPEIPTESEIAATVKTDAALRATTVAIDISQGGLILAGQQFGTLDKRLYEIGTIVSRVGTVTTVTIMPPLRAASAGETVLGGPGSGDQLSFTRPTCLMRCMNLNDELRKLEVLRFATLNLEFVEYL